MSTKRPVGFKPDMDTLSLWSAATSAKMKLAARTSPSEASVPSKPSVNKVLIETRKKKQATTVKMPNSIPFTREDDDIEGIGPGSYDPIVTSVYKKAPSTTLKTYVGHYDPCQNSSSHTNLMIKKRYFVVLII